ncbi:MAG: aspartate ammonia-lyase [Candidatus Aenigmarchaeota archaeon]|nr:aspartate ammonia-lyase [Candidatus Aenigmarchaeota archaeon]
MRKEKDYLGEVGVPEDAYYGVQTARAVDNFRISGLTLQKRFIRSYAIIKKAAAHTNMLLKNLDKEKATAIIKACDDVISGLLASQFVVDVYQAGAGTSTNMNLNEVIANRAIELLGGKKGDYKLVHPNDHVNMAQSTNDTFHVAIHIAAVDVIENHLLPILEEYEKALEKKIREFNNIVKSGRTHLQDAVPIMLSQEFSGYSVKGHIETIKRANESMKEIGIGGTAVGTGINADKRYAAQAAKEISNLINIRFVNSRNIFEFMQSLSHEAQLSAALRNLSLAFIKISNDLRLLGSGPATGLAEISLPAVQPGSSIMPGKVNPVIAEMMDMICFQVVGNDTTITLAAQAGQLELNVMMPVVAYNLLNSVEILSNGIKTLTEKCLSGITVNEEKMLAYLERNPVIITALTPHIGYENAAAVVKEAYATAKPIRQIVLEKKLMTKEQLDKVLDFRKMTRTD